MTLRLFWLVIFALAAVSARADCLPVAEAGQHVGETRCVSGKVLRVERADHGLHFLEFCDNHQFCPFTVVVFADGLRSIGDVRELAGKSIEVHGVIKLYDGRAEIILERRRQLQGEVNNIPALPKNFDVQNKGRFSAGTFSSPHPAKTSSKKRQTAKLPIDLTADSSE